jgi:hypothetical protein
MIILLGGHSGAGKSTICGTAAQELGLTHRRMFADVERLALEQGWGKQEKLNNWDLLLASWAHDIARVPPETTLLVETHFVLQPTAGASAFQKRNFHIGIPFTPSIPRDVFREIGTTEHHMSIVLLTTPDTCTVDRLETIGEVTPIPRVHAERVAEYACWQETHARALKHLGAHRVVARALNNTRSPVQTVGDLGAIMRGIA